MFKQFHTRFVDYSTHENHLTFQQKIGSFVTENKYIKETPWRVFY